MGCRAIDVFPLIASSYGGSGMCPANDGEFSESQQAELLLALNQATPMLLKRIDAKDTLAKWDVPVQGGCFPLPPDCLEVRQAFLNGCSLDIRDRWYEGQIGYKMGNPGLWCGSRDLIDMGDGFAIPEEWPNQYQDARLGFLAESDDDAGKMVQVKLKDRYGNVYSETVELLANQLVASTAKSATDILYINKGITDGAVIGYITITDQSKWRLMRIPSNVASPTYHKKKLPLTFGNCNGCLSIIGKLRFTPLQSVYDTLPICDEMALSFALQALHHLKNRDLTEYNNAMLLAVNELDRQLQDVHPPAVVTQMAVRSGLRFPRKCFL